jgi:hypothetical protein
LDKAKKILQLIIIGMNDSDINVITDFNMILMMKIQKTF